MADRELLEITQNGDITVVGFNMATISSVSGISEISSKVRDYITENKPKIMLIDFDGVGNSNGDSGDIVLTGSPEGVASGKGDNSGFLKPGDVLESEIEGIGTLRNTIIEDTLAPSWNW